MSDPFPQLILQSRGAFLGLPAASNHNIDYATQVKENLSFKRNHIPIIGSKVKAILLEGEFCLLVELHREECAPAACAAGLFHYI